MKKKALFYLTYTVFTTGMLYLVFYELRHDDFPAFHQDVLWQALGTTLLVHLVFVISGAIAPKPPSEDKRSTRRSV